MNRAELNLKPGDLNANGKKCTRDIEAVIAAQRYQNFANHAREERVEVMKTHAQNDKPHSGRALTTHLQIPMDYIHLVTIVYTL